MKIRCECLIPKRGSVVHEFIHRAPFLVSKSERSAVADWASQAHPPRAEAGGWDCARAKRITKMRPIPSDRTWSGATSPQRLFRSFEAIRLFATHSCCSLLMCSYSARGDTGAPYVGDWDQPKLPCTHL